ncbi:MAG: methylase protein [Candidatus Woesebacteria bacterium GW2011_GWA1_34_41]|nr:MAG: methylase protein [Candidatus Woesebacteria bacterium GW2011_GWA1_34_41]
MGNLIWHTEKRKVKELVPYESNPRKLSNEQAEKLKDSLNKFNLVEIPAIDTDNKIVAGHQRIKIMMLLGRGEEEIDVRLPNRKLTNGEFTEYNIRSNKNVGEFDWDLLAKFDESFLADIGFSSGELDGIFDVDVPEEFSLEKELLKLNIHQINTKKGDTYALGENFKTYEW